MHEEPARIDTAELRQVLSAFVTGVTVITTVDASGHPHGVTANSFNSVSLDPPLVLWSQALRAYSHPAFLAAERFAVNILALDQVHVSARFAKAGADKFGATAVRRGLGEVPLIEGCAAALECRRVAHHAAGDHMIFIGQVERIERSGRAPLAFGGGKYLTAQAHDFGALTAEAAHANRARLQAVRLVTHAAVELSARLDETVGVAVWGNQGPTVVHWELAREPVSMNLRVGAVLPLLGSATGMAFAAWLPGEETAAFATTDNSGLEAPAPLETLEPQLAAIRRDGQASLHMVSNFTDRPQVAVNAVSAPVFDRDGHMLAALTVLGEAARLDVAPTARVPQALRACAEELSRRIRGAH